jgi:hypothetical protein
MLFLTGNLRRLHPHNPDLQHDEDKLEDLDTEAEDHAG